MTALAERPAFTGEVHPFAARFPMLPEEELAELVDDIAANGLLNRILLDPDGQLLDGRNRLEACSRAGVEPVFEVVAGNPVAVIVSANVRRRQMAPGQAAMAAAIGLAEQGKRKNGRWERNSLDIGTGADIAARTIHLAGVVLDYDADRGTEFADRVLTGALTLKEAHRLVMAARRREQEAIEAESAARRAAEKAAEKARTEYAALTIEAPDLADLVRQERLSLADALAALENRRQEQAAARQQALNAWSEAVDGLSVALAYFASGFTPPEDLPPSHVQPAEFSARVAKLATYLEDVK